MSEWGNPAEQTSVTQSCKGSGSEPWEVKHLSTRRKRKKVAQAKYFLSSGERNGISPNRLYLYERGCKTIDLQHSFLFSLFVKAENWKQKQSAG